MEPIKRRDFLKTGLMAGGALILANPLAGSVFSNQPRGVYKSPSPGEAPDIVTIPGDDPESNIVRLLEPLGGIGKFVSAGQAVGLLANSPWRYSGYYTNPDLVLALASQCLKAGAKQIVILNPDVQNYWERGKLFSNYKTMIDGFKFSSNMVETDVPKGILLKMAEVYKEFLDADVYISVPVAKHHAGVVYSGNLKGLMGVSSSDTNRFMHSPEGDYSYDKHEYLAQCIADLNLIRKPDLCVIDATECALSNGPAGPGETIKLNKIIAGTDPLATDVYAAGLLGFLPDDILTFSRAYEHGLGEIDPLKISLREL